MVFNENTLMKLSIKIAPMWKDGSKPSQVVLSLSVELPLCTQWLCTLCDMAEENHIGIESHKTQQ